MNAGLCLNYNFYTFKVKTQNIKVKSQVTKAFNSQVGTSEAIRLLTINKIYNRKLTTLNSNIENLNLNKNYYHNL